MATGFNDVDLQHKKLILIIEDIHKTIESPPDEYVLRISKDLKKLTDYTLYHFGEEEELMKQYHYPDYEAHKKQHEAFISEVQNQIKTLSDTDRQKRMHFYLFLGKWLINHIAGSDQAWAEYIKTQKP
ncbi:bacteriohemerythrin [Brucepastera parasyntrophica]|uniref:bacteriohemerythrin n=1 Tax=Brucepastera parasyntrophica TaxID=2880008 RepID=UPI003F70D232